MRGEWVTQSINHLDDDAQFPFTSYSVDPSTARLPALLEARFLSITPFPEPTKGPFSSRQAFSWDPALSESTALSYQRSRLGNMPPQLLFDNNALSLRSTNDSSPTSCLLHNAVNDSKVTGSSSSGDGSAASSCCASDAECEDHDEVGGAQEQVGGLVSIGRTKSVYSFSKPAADTSDEREDTPTMCFEGAASFSSLALETPQQQTPSDYPGDVHRFRQMQQLEAASDIDRTAGAIAVRGAAFRAMMEPHLRRARVLREHTRQQVGRCSRDLVTSASTKPREHELTSHYRSIADSVGVPYTALRQERAFLFDEHSYPMQHLLGRALQIDDLTRLHELGRTSDDLVTSLLRDQDRRRAFHAAYDGFVTAFCIPLVHSLAITQSVCHTSSSSTADQITYRYQAFPSLRVVQPGDPASPPVCDTMLGHSIGCLHFCIPLTPSQGDNAALYVESHPGREDWHPLQTRAFGLGFVFDGARCLYFDLGGDARHGTSVSLHFRVLLYREPRGRSGATAMDVDDGLCPLRLVEDRLSRTDSTYYEEAVVDTGRRPHVSSAVQFDQLVMKKHGDRLLPVSMLMKSSPTVVVG